MILPERVAEVYQAAAGCAPTRAVQERFGVSRSTAIRLVMTARRVGLLPSTTPGKARAFGEHEPRTVRWGDRSASWLACTVCRTPWPCPAVAGEETPGDRLRRVAAGRREYADGAPDDMRQTLLAEADLFDTAARVADDDVLAACGLIPSWQWTAKEEQAGRGGES